MSPAWPLEYDGVRRLGMIEAEELFQVHGARGEDPLEPPSGGPYPFPPFARAQSPGIVGPARAHGLHPFHLPLGIRLDQKEDGKATPTSLCMRCTPSTAFPA